jgi:predicted transcriptional regulator/transcriptional regulator with XRE-family HTH domain
MVASGRKAESDPAPLPPSDEAMGRHLRALRLERGLAQAEVAEVIGVSPAYLSLLETGKRPMQLPLLLGALGHLGVDVETFMAQAGERRVDEGLARLLDEPLFRTLGMGEDDLRAASGEPRAAATITALFHLYKNTRAQLDQLLVELTKEERSRREQDGPGAGLAFDHSPYDEVIDFLEASGNWFGELEARAEVVRAAHALPEQCRPEHLIRALARLDVRVEEEPPHDSSVIRRLDPSGGVLTLARDVPEHRRLFQLAHTVALRLFDREQLHEPVMGRARLAHAEAPRLLKIHLANYLAGALLLPYAPLLRDAQRTRYDVERLARIWNAGYETVAHRLTNLGDPSRRGVPFHFLRVDVAGNISKRYAATGLRFPHGTGSCPKWIVHQAFLTPHAIARQYSVFPDGRMYFCFAKVLSEPIAGSLARGTVYAIGMGTAAEDARHLAYADDMPFVDPGRMAVLVGTTCRFCERTDCNQRAAPSYKYAFRVDEYVKKDNFYSPLVEADVAVGALRKKK